MWQPISDRIAARISDTFGGWFDGSPISETGVQRGTTERVNRRFQAGDDATARSSAQ